MKILFATPECTPYVKTGGLGDVSAALPATLAGLGHDVHLLLPAYRGMKVAGEIGDGVDLPPWGPWPAAQLVPVKIPNGVTLLLLACPHLYQRPGGPYVDASGRDYHDNALRFGLLARVAAQLGTVHSPLKGWSADVVHANDWPCGLAPLYLAQSRLVAPQEPTAASVLTIHNLAFQGVFPMASADVLDVPHPWRGMDGVEFWGQLSMLKGGIQFADAITTVSPTYAREIQTPEHGNGFDGILRARASRLRGILNGIDTRQWDPEKDPLLPSHYTREQPQGKALCKAALQERVGLPQDRRPMLFAVVSRLTPQKGIDLVLGALPRLLGAGAQLVVLGQGDPGLQQALKDAAQKHSRQVAVTLGFDEGLAHLVEAGGRRLPDALALRALRPQPDVQPGVWHAPDRRAGGRPARFRDRCRRGSGPRHRVRHARLRSVRTGRRAGACAAPVVRARGMAPHPGQRHGAPLRMGRQRAGILGGLPARADPGAQRRRRRPGQPGGLTTRSPTTFSPRKSSSRRTAGTMPRRDGYTASTMATRGAQPRSTGTSSPRRNCSLHR
jgi:starch synthase